MSSNGKPVAYPAEGHRKRLRDRVLRDATTLADHELLESLLGCAIPRRDTKPLAKRLLARFGGLRGVLDAHAEELLGEEGVGPAVACLFELLRELRARYAEAPLRQKTVLCTKDDVAELARIRLAGSRDEEMWVALVDNGNRLLNWERLHRGTTDAAPFFPREVVELCFKHKATGIFLVHNHPGGNGLPSAHDVQATRAMHTVAQSVGLRLLDHIIVTDRGSYSFHNDHLF